MSGATVTLARLQAIFGRPTPTKTVRAPFNMRAATAIIISDAE
jgi:hypothetical protein